jgi:hypothetical protein
MKELKSVAFLIVLLAMAASTKAQTAKEKYLGKSPCAADLQSERPDFSLRLDKRTRTDLVNRNLAQSTLLLIVQYKDQSDSCGVIRDAVEIRHLSKVFHFDCVDPQAPHDVVVGTREADDQKLTGVAIDAWRIDLDKLVFNRLDHKVICTYKSYAGSDDGGDLVDQAKSRVLHTVPGQTGRPHDKF